MILTGPSLCLIFDLLYFLLQIALHVHVSSNNNEAFWLAQITDFVRHCFVRLSNERTKINGRTFPLDRKNKRHFLTNIKSTEIYLRKLGHAESWVLSTVTINLKRNWKMDVYVINKGWISILNWRANEEHVCKNLHIDYNTNFPESKHCRLWHNSKKIIAESLYLSKVVATPP